MAEHPKHGYQRSARALGLAASVAASTLIWPGPVTANIPLTLPVKPPVTLGPIIDQFDQTKVELQDRLFIGDKTETENFYRPYPTVQVQRIVKSFLGSMASAYEELANRPFDPKTTTSSCVASDGNRLFDQASQQRLLGTAAFFRDLANNAPDARTQSVQARENALSILVALGPFTPLEIANSDGSPALNKAATHPRGIALTMVDDSYFALVKPLGQFAGSVMAKGPDFPEAAILKSTLPTDGARSETLQRMQSLGELLTSVITQQHQFPDAILLEDSRSKVTGLNLVTHGVFILKPLDCTHAQPQ